MRWLRRHGARDFPVRVTTVGTLVAATRAGAGLAVLQDRLADGLERVLPRSCPSRCRSTWSPIRTCVACRTCAPSRRSCARRSTTASRAPADRRRRPKTADATSLGFTGNASVARWPEALRRVKQRYPGSRWLTPATPEEPR